jgi:hypothetical protein
MKNQSDFMLFGHKVCLWTKQLGRKRQIILPINSERISHTRGGISESISNKIKNNELIFFTTHPP